MYGSYTESLSLREVNYCAYRNRKVRTECHSEQRNTILCVHRISVEVGCPKKKMGWFVSQQFTHFVYSYTFLRFISQYLISLFFMRIFHIARLVALCQTCFRFTACVRQFNKISGSEVPQWDKMGCSVRSRPIEWQVARLALNFILQSGRV